MEVPTLMPTILKIMVAVVATITIILMGLLVIKIYRDDGHGDDRHRGS